MKRTVKILALVLVFVMAATALVSCGKRLSGEYAAANSAGNTVTLTFKGNKFEYKTGTTDLKGTYEIKRNGENYTITMTCNESVVNGTSTKLEEPYFIGGGELALRIGEDYITLGSGTNAKKYTKN